MIGGAARPLTRTQSQVLRVIADARAGEISGESISIWLGRDKTAIYTVLRSLVKRGAIAARWPEKRGVPDRMRMLYSMKQREGEGQ